MQHFPAETPEKSRGQVIQGWYSVQMGRYMLIGIVIAPASGATQWDQQRPLISHASGLPWFDLLGLRFITRGLFEWWFLHGAHAPRVFDTGGTVAGGMVVQHLVAIPPCRSWRSRQSPAGYDAHGFGTLGRCQIRHPQNWTDPQRGVFLNGDDQYLRQQGGRNMSRLLPTRSGRAWAPVVPFARGIRRHSRH